MPHPVREIPDARIPLPDGRALAARLWLPEGAGPVPAILEYLPYRHRDGTAARDATTHPVFAAEGFACVRVDIAGSGDSDGLFDDEYSEQEMRDGEAVIAWIAAQDWCDGAVGMIGISWGGFNGLQLAARRPPALKAVVTMCSTVDRFADDIHYMGGCLLTDNFNWGAQMTAYMSRPPDPAMRADWRARWIERIERMPFLAADWLRRPVRDDYWRHGSVCEDWGAITAPTLAIGGWNDAYVNAPVALAENLSAPVRALIGPWEHKYPHISRILPADLHGEALRWFGRWLGGRETGAEASPAFRFWLTEHDGPPSPLYGPRPGGWAAEARWPSPDVRPRALSLTPDGLGERAAEGVIPVATPLSVGRKAAYFCPGMRIDNEFAPDQREDDARSVCFDLAPLAAPLEIVGRPELEIAFRADRPAAQLVARLCDVAPDGTSMRVSYRALNLTHHAGHDRPRALRPGETARARIALNACAHRFRRGHRLRLALSTAYWPVLWPSPAPATVTLDLAGCRLILPERVGGEPADPQPPGPPRAFPTLDAEILRGTTSETASRVDADGTLLLETFDDFGMARDRGHGLANGHTVRQRFAIREGDPLSARHEAVWRYEFARGDWGVAIDSESLMTCDADNFVLRRRVIASEADETVLDRTWNATIPRGLL
jgi:putative CocE/NonD family hydrolase